jgi:hypothetical protein
MTLLVRLERLGASSRTRATQPGFDAESPDLRSLSVGHPRVPKTTAADDERYARDSSEGDNET